MRFAALITIVPLLAGTVVADWKLYTEDCFNSFGGSWTSHSAMATKDACNSKKTGSWDGEEGERRMNSDNPCDPKGDKKLRYVRDIDEYDVYWYGEPHKKIGRCTPSGNKLKQCNTLFVFCGYFEAYNCKSPACNTN